MLPTESKSQRQIGPYIIALLQNYSFLCVLSFENISLLFLVFLYKCYIHIKYLYTQKFKFSQQRKIYGQYHIILWEKWTKSSRDKKEVFSCNLPMNCWKLCNARDTIWSVSHQNEMAIDHFWCQGNYLNADKQKYECKTLKHKTKKSLRQLRSKTGGSLGENDNFPVMLGHLPFLENCHLATLLSKILLYNWR